MFINYTNHPSENWSEKQKHQALQYGNIVDIPFPVISADMGKDDIYELAGRECENILCQLAGQSDSAVLCQGEFNFTFLMVRFLQKENITVLSAVSERKVRESSQNGVTIKEAEFDFQGFREYDIRQNRPEDKSGLVASGYRKDRNLQKENKILIVPLGKGGYQNTRYVDEEGTEIAVTGYAFDAIIKKENPNRVMLIGTKTSGWNGVIDWYSLKQTEQKKREAEILKERFKENPEIEQKAVEKYIRDAGKFDCVKISLIPEGKNEAELQEYFEKMRESFQKILEGIDKPKIIFDISNGFRSIPLYMMMLIRYVGMIDRNELSYTVYYGIFDARDRKNNSTPLVNLTTVSELTEWINAISEFRSLGSVKKLCECLKMEKTKKNKEVVEGIIGEFERFNYAMNSNNLYYLETGINYIAGMNIVQMDLSEPARLMLSDLKKDFYNRFYAEKGMYTHSELLVKLAQLFTDQGRYGAAAVSIQEGIITYIMERYLSTKLKEINNLGEIEYEKYMREFGNRQPVKKHFDQKVNLYLESKDVDKEEEYYRFIQLYKKVKDNIRNVEAHIISKEDVPTSEEMEKWLSESTELLLNDMKQFRSEKQVLKLDKMYEDYEIKSEKEESAIDKFLRGTENGEWNLLNPTKPELREENRRELEKEGVRIESIDKLRKEMLLLKEICSKREVIETDLNKMPIIRKFVEKWIESDMNNNQKNYNSYSVKIETARILDYLKTKKTAKGVGKNAYMRLTDTMKSTLRKKVREILMEET